MIFSSIDKKWVLGNLLNNDKSEIDGNLSFSNIKKWVSRNLSDNDESKNDANMYVFQEDEPDLRSSK